MTRISSLILVKLCITFLCSAQSNLYQTQPLCGTSKLVRDNLKAYARDEPKVALVFHFKPGSCPRCEGVMTTIYDRIPATNFKLVIAEMTSRSGFDEYVKQNPHLAHIPILIDTARTWRKIIDHSRTELSVPFVYTIDPVAGSVHGIHSLLGARVGDSLIDQLLHKGPEMSCNNGSKTAWAKVNNKWPFRFTPSINGLPLTEQAFFDVLDDGQIVVLDRITGSFALYSLKGKQELLIRQPDSVLGTYVSTKNRHKLDELKAMGIAKHIPLCLGLSADQSQYLISGSLPDIQTVYNAQTGDTDVIYSNIAYRLEVDRQGKAGKRIPWAMDNRGVFSGSHSEFLAFDSLFITGVDKGWPVMGSDDQLLADSIMNPFHEAFYQETPAFELTTANHSLGYFGQWPDLYRKASTGYGIQHHLFAHGGDYLVWGDGWSGNVQIFRKDALKFKTPQISFSLFPEKESKIPPGFPDSFTSKLDYIFWRADQLNQSFVYDLAIQGNALYFLLRRGADLWVRRTDLRGNMQIEKQLPYKCIPDESSFRLLWHDNAWWLIGAEDNTDGSNQAGKGVQIGIAKIEFEH